MNSFNYSVPKDIVGTTLLKLAEKNKKIVVLSSDVSVSTNIEAFKEKFPNRFFELGIAEQSTMSVAGGMAAEGFVPVYVALAIFSCGMTWAQMRQVCNAGLNVKVIGTHAGADDGQDGSGHHATEDIAISRVIPRMTVLTPSDENEVASAIEKMLEMEGPAYMRIAREDTPIIHHKDCGFAVGEAEVIYDTGNDFAIVFEGSALKQALDAWKQLGRLDYKGKIVSIRSIKPIDRNLILKLADEVKVIVTVENHSIIGGLYGSISEILASVPHSAKVSAVGFKDTFLESGSSVDIKKKYGLSGGQICKKVMDSLETV